jgi:diguanylate cyclase (GGDEF)-like protein
MPASPPAFYPGIRDMVLRQGSATWNCGRAVLDSWKGGKGMGKAETKEEKKRIKKEFDRSNFMLNLERMQIASIAFWFIGIVYLVLIFTGFFKPTFANQQIIKTLVFIILGILLLAFAYITMLRRAAGRIKHFQLHRVALDAFILMILVCSVLLFLGSKEGQININPYILITLGVAAVPCLGKWEMGIIYLLAHTVFMTLVFTIPAYRTSPQLFIAIANSTCFVAFAYLVSLLTNNLRWSAFRKDRRIREQNMELAHLANTDYLTNLYNKRYAYAAMRMEWNRSIRSEKPLSLILLDIDSFKDYNDAYGHIQGDQCLKRVAEVIRRSARRQTDQVCRFGGEELLVILPYTSGVDAYAIGEKIRKDVADAAIPHQNSVVAPIITVSAGVASMVGDRNIDFEVLLERADRALYRAKHNGRNMVVM